MKPLTIEQLKALPVGDWVWVVNIRRNWKGYYRREKNEFVVDDKIQICFNGIDVRNLRFEDYGKTWLAYKNKERAEGYNEVKRFAEYVGSKISGHSDYHGDNILSALYCAAAGKEIHDVTPLEYRKTVELPCKPGDTAYVLHNNEVSEEQVLEVTIDKDSTIFTIGKVYDSFKSYGRYYLSTFNQNWFVDRNKAEQRSKYGKFQLEQSR